MPRRLLALLLCSLFALPAIEARAQEEKPKEKKKRGSFGQPPEMIFFNLLISQFVVAEPSDTTLKSFVDATGSRYKLDPTQRELLREIAVDYVKQFRAGTAGEYRAMLSTVEAFDEETPDADVAAYADRFQKVHRDIGAIVGKFSDELHRIIDDDDQSARHKADTEQFRGWLDKTLDHHRAEWTTDLDERADSRRSRWSGAGWWEKQWELHASAAIEHYKMSQGQIARVDAVLADFKKQAADYRKLKEADIAAWSARYKAFKESRASKDPAVKAAGAAKVKALESEAAGFEKPLADLDVKFREAVRGVLNDQQRGLKELKTAPKGTINRYAAEE